jgi:hypothetical protein
MNTIILQNGKEVEIASKTKKTVHNVFLIDASGSMNSYGYNSNVIAGDRPQSKYSAAFQGVNEELQELKSFEDVEVKMSVYEFDSNKEDTERITEHCFATPIADVKTITGRGASGNTPLYQSIAYVIEKFLRKAADGDRVVIKIFTDGAHNCNWGKYGTEKACRELITDAEKNRGFVITFVGTEQDTRYVVSNLNINASNTSSYDGTSKGLQEALTRSRGSTRTYLSRVSKGTDTTADFFTNLDTDTTTTNTTTNNKA